MIDLNNEAYETVITSLKNILLDESSCPALGNHDQDELDKVLETLESRKIRSLVSICSELLDYDRFTLKWTPLYPESLHLAHDVRDSLSKEWIDEAQDLCNLLNKDHVQALLWTCDMVANQQYEPSLPGEDEDSMMDLSCSDYNDEMSSVKIVQVIKNQEPLGATVKFEDITGNIVISRIIHGGAAHRSGLINVGDYIHEVNGYTLRGRSFMEILSLLENECRNSVICFKLLPGDYGTSKTTLNESRVRVKALFDYFPSQDPNHPCPEAGLSFKKGDILHIVNMEEDDWWQARQELTMNDDHIDPYYYTATRAGLIPSRQLQERRLVALREMGDVRELRRMKHLKMHHSLQYKLKKSLKKHRKVKKTMYRVKDSDELDRGDIVTYMEVDLLKPSSEWYRPLVMIAPYPLDTNQMIDSLIQHDPQLFTRPVPHTTRQPHFWEQDGCDYYFVSHEWFVEEIRNSRFPEYGQFNDNLYGIHMNSILTVINGGQICLLNPNPRSLKLLFCRAIKPYIVFLRPSYDILFHKSAKFIPLCINSDKIPVKASELKQMALNSMRMEYLYTQYFDKILVVEDKDQILKTLLDTVKLVNIEDQWVPTSWILG